MLRSFRPQVQKGALGKDTLGLIDDFTERLGEAGVRAGDRAGTGTEGEGPGVVK